MTNTFSNHTFYHTFSLPKEEHKFKEAMRRIEGCDITNSKISEGKEGPEVEEVYRCPCGDVVLRQKSIITDINNPRRGSIEMIQIRSEECSL